MSLKIVAVHGGAGYHSPSSERSVKRALRQACSRSLRSLEHTGSSCRAVEDAICALEDDECLNAGYGSNLTVTGEVECDASIMDGETGGFGSVGAVSGVKNPISLAHTILDYAARPHPLDRVPPLTLVAQGGHIFAADRGLPLVSPAMQISPKAKEDWELWKARLQDAEQSKGSTDGLSDRQDTVGAVACDMEGRLSAGVSSGGLLLKHSGRVGEASVFGAGCWAHSYRDQSRGVACSISGTGEQIIRSSLARKLAEALETSPAEDTHEILQRILSEFHQSCKNRNDAEANAGILLLTQEPNDDDGHKICRLWCGFTTRSMAIAYATSLNQKPKALVLRRQNLKNLAAGNGPHMYLTALPMSY